MTDARREWISKRAYMIWEAAGRPHGFDAAHWDQAVRERDELELVTIDKPAPAKKGAKPLIELSGKTASAAATGKKAASGEAKKAAPKARTKTKAATEAEGKLA